VVKALKATPGAVAYVSHDRVERDHLLAVKLRNAAGAYVAASEAGFRSAVVESDLSRRGDDGASLMDRPGPATWPITMTSFLLVDAQPQRADAASPALRFVYWCFMHGDDLTRGTGFAPIPVALQSRLAGRLMTVKPQDGKPLNYLAM
jgi:phosphate transport system substrate-binding protein